MNFPILKKFLEDPSCVDNGNFGGFWKNKRDYERRWEYISETYKTFNVHYFKESEYSYYIMIEVPSERRGNTYDVVIHFFTEFDNVASQSNLQQYQIRMFSNNPEFAFWFGYANNKRGLIIDFLLDKFPRDILETPASKHNPQSHVGFDHSFYHAGKYLLNKPRFLNKSFFESKLLPFSKDTIYKLCRPLDQTMEEYKEFRDKTANKNRFGKEGSGTLSGKIDSGIKDLKAKFDSLKDTGREINDKVHRNVNKIMAKKSNASNKSASGVRRITPKKKIGK